MPGLEHGAEPALAEPVEHAVVADGQLLAVAREEAIDLVDREQTALHELLGQRPRIAALALHADEQLPILFRRDQAVVAQRVEQIAGGVDRHRDRNASRTARGRSISPGGENALLKGRSRMGSEQTPGGRDAVEMNNEKRTMNN